MANEDLVARLLTDIDAWNDWREAESETDALLDLSGADLTEADLREADLRRADLTGADLTGANLIDANLIEANMIEANLALATMIGANLSGASLIDAVLLEADLSGASLIQANLALANLGGTQLFGANLSGANLSEASLVGANMRGVDMWRTNLRAANLSRANLSEADLTEANMIEANLSGASLVGATIEGANLASARVYGVSVWDVEGSPESQTDLVITPDDSADVTVDDLNVAQFVYLLLNNPEIRKVIDTVARKAVLILGRFTLERKPVLDAVRDALRNKGLAPILFDFEKPATRGYGETIRVLAGMCRFVIADLTSAVEVPNELMQVVPVMPRLPVQPIVLAGEPVYTTFSTDVAPYPWVLPVQQYASIDDLVGGLAERVIAPADNKWQEITGIIE